MPDDVLVMGQNQVIFGQGVIGSLHMWGKDLRTGWFPCENPERPTDANVLWHYDGRDCLGCRVTAKALKLRDPDDPHVDWLADMMGVKDV